MTAGRLARLRAGLVASRLGDEQLRMLERVHGCHAPAHDRPDLPRFAREQRARLRRPGDRIADQVAPARFERAGGRRVRRDRPTIASAGGPAG